MCRNFAQKNSVHKIVKKIVENIKNVVVANQHTKSTITAAAKSFCKNYIFLNSQNFILLLHNSSIEYSKIIQYIARNFWVKYFEKYKHEKDNVLFQNILKIQINKVHKTNNVLWLLNFKEFIWLLYLLNHRKIFIDRITMILSKRLKRLCLPILWVWLQYPWISNQK